MECNLSYGMIDSAVETKTQNLLQLNDKENEYLFFFRLFLLGERHMGIPHQQYAISKTKNGWSDSALFLKSHIIQRHV